MSHQGNPVSKSTILCKFLLGWRHASVECQVLAMSLSGLCKLNLFLAALGLHCYAQAFSSCSELGLLSSCRAQASHCHGFSCCSTQTLRPRLSSCGTRAQLPYGMWDLPEPGIKPVFPTLAGGFLTTGPPDKSLNSNFIWWQSFTVGDGFLF